MFNPSSGDQEPEFICLTNTTRLDHEPLLPRSPAPPAVNWGGSRDLLRAYAFLRDLTLSSGLCTVGYVMSSTMTIDLPRSTRPRCFAAVVTARPGVGLMWRVYPKRVLVEQEGSI